VTLAWQGDPPAAGQLFVGAGNLVQNRWDWFAPPASGPLQLPNLGPYLSTHPYLLLAVAVLGEQPATLNGVQLGDRWIINTVDMSLLTAPVMRFETAQLEADWATRNPVESGYEQITERIESDGTRRIVVAHMVDGRRHIGGIVIPPAEDFELLPVMVMCHPGAVSVNLSGRTWLQGLCSDADVCERFLLVVPSFRGERLTLEGLGSWTSGGHPSVFDRDADDAIALLDCVLNHFSNADRRCILASGYSRGGQVAMRIAQRDSRIMGVIDFCGMADEWTVNGQGYMQEFIAGRYPEPETWDWYYHSLWEYEHGIATVWQTRVSFLRSCIVYQADRLPKLQIHHGAEDPTVPIHEADRLVAVLETIPEADYEYCRYPFGGHAIQTMTGAGERVEAFIKPLLPPSRPPRP
jgi:dienelactone hydrolase